MGPWLLLAGLLALALAAPGAHCGEDAGAGAGAAAAPEAALRAGRTSGRRLRILCIMTIDASSHHLWMASLTVRLAELGHHVHSVDIKVPANRPPNLNVSVIEPFKIDGPASELMKQLLTGDSFTKMQIMGEFSVHECERSLSSAALQQFVDPKFDGQFDVVIINYGLADCYLGLVHRFNYPATVLLTPFPGGSVWVDTVMGNPALPAILPHYAAPVPTPLSFAQRLFNSVIHVYGHYIRQFKIEPRIDKILRKTFGPSVPPVAELKKHVSLALVNEVPVLEPARPFPPSIVPVGGMHVKPANLTNIPADLRQWMDSATDGFILMSFGSVVKGSNMDVEKRKALLEAFASLKQRVLWKFETDDVNKDLPPNVRIGKWLPQNDILGHPNLRLFISHSGGLSTQEAAYHGVPVLGVPHMIDQFINIEKIKKLGMGRKMTLQELTRDRLLSEVREMVENPGYRENAQRISRLLRDQKEPPLERAVWWVEYVARHGGAPHLRSPALDLEWYQLMQLDVFAVLALAAVLVLGLVLLALRLVLRCAARCCFAPRKPPVRREKKD